MGDTANILLRVSLTHTDALARRTLELSLKNIPTARHR